MNKRRAAIFAGVLVAVVAGVAAPAEASTNIGWVYTPNASGAVFFDADLNGQPGIEKITVCDNKTDGHGIEARVFAMTGNDEWLIFDPSNDGHCVAFQGNLFTEETWVGVSVYEYAGTWKGPKASAYGYA